MPLFAATILLSACLLFLVQPIIAKQILPWFGGTSAVWTTCMVFFQLVLLAGYAYAHGITRWLALRTQVRVHVTLLAVSLAFLPIIPSVALKPAGDEDAALRILLLLAVTIGLPYFLLSSTGPLLQKWVAHRLPEQRVYRLFALSNFGSLLGLLAFPFAIEPFAASAVQSWVWSAGYLAFAAACASSAWSARRQPPPLAGASASTDAAIDAATDAAADAAADASTGASANSAAAAPAGACAAAPAAPPGAPAVGDYLLWLVLAALGSVLLLAATSHITQNVASVPFLWVVPLTLYLLTFVLAFEGRGGRGWYDTRWGSLLAVFFAVLMSAGLSANNAVLDIGLAVPLYCIGMFVCVLFCHGELAARKPAPVYLTQFYLMLSLGGALGGLAVGLVAPRVFSTYYEMPIALAALCALALLAAWSNRALMGPWVISLSLTAMLGTAATSYQGFSYRNFLRNDVILAERNFYGTLRVRERGQGEAETRSLVHGVILHGEQLTRSPRRLEPGSYYSATSGVGLAIQARQASGPVRIGVVGLGVGTLSAYGRPGDRMRFYELDPDVLRLAQSHFTYLPSAQATMTYAIGDARLSLERELAQGQPGGFDVLAIDAFSSDSIPVHLITREAIALYVRHLAPDGILAIHISNRFLDLQPVLANIAQDAGLAIRHVADSPTEASGHSSTDWVLLARAPATLQAGGLAERAEPLAPQPDQSLWTDQFNNLLDVLKVRPLDQLRALLGRD